MRETGRSDGSLGETRTENWEAEEESSEMVEEDW